MSILCPYCRNTVEPRDPIAEEIVCTACGSKFRIEAGDTGSWSPYGEKVRSAGFESGQMISHYRILEKLGSGGMGVVYRAEDVRLGRHVALKFLPDRYAQDRQTLERFQREARTASALSHPHICTLHDIDALAGQPFIVMEFLEGRTLKSRLVGKPLSPEELVELGIQIADGLDAAHALGIVHRDIKPGNIFISPRGQAKILDFGLAKLTAASAEGRSQSVTPVGDQETLSTPGMVLGTAAYMSPEQIRNQELDGRSDLFSFGSVLYEMATGRLAFPGLGSADHCEAILNKEPPTPRELNPAVPDELQHIILKALEKDREVRYQTASDLRADLKRLKRDTESGRLTATTLTALAKPPPQRPWRLVMGVTGGLALALFFLWIYLKHPTVSESERTTLAAPRTTPFLAGGAIRRQPAWSPTGNLIAYVSDEAGNDDIWICDPSGANPINLTADCKGVDAFPTWSPDGQRIAFFSERDGGGIYTMAALGGTVRKLVAVKPGILYTFSLSWGKNELVYTNFDASGRKQVYGISETNPVPECLTAKVGAPDGHYGELSPSGDLLVFLNPGIYLTAELYIGRLSTGKFERLEKSVGMPHWSPRGDRVFFLSERDGRIDLWAVDVDPKTGVRAGPSKRLTSALDLSDYSFSPDGRKLVASRAKSQCRLWSFPMPHDPITNLADGRPLTTGGFFDMRPYWAHDGSALYFSSNRQDSTDVWKLSLGSTAPVRLTSGPGKKIQASPSPDGRWIVVDIIDERGQYLYLMRPDGSARHLVDPKLPEKFSATFAANWAPIAKESDDLRLAATFTTAEKGDRIGIASIDRQTGTARDIHILDLPGGMKEYPRWSPDGEYLAYEAVSEGSWDLWITAPDGKNTQRLTFDPGNERGAAWSPDGKFLYYIRDDRSVWRMPMNSGQPSGPPQRWAEFPKARIDYGGIDLTKDQAVLAVVEDASDLWMVEFPEK
jgi:Tol biopolymer transport system component